MNENDDISSGDALIKDAVGDSGSGDDGSGDVTSGETVSEFPKKFFLKNRVLLHSRKHMHCHGTFSNLTTTRSDVTIKMFTTFMLIQFSNMHVSSTLPYIRYTFAWEPRRFLSLPLTRMETHVSSNTTINVNYVRLRTGREFDDGFLTNVYARANVTDFDFDDVLPNETCMVPFRNPIFEGSFKLVRSDTNGTVRLEHKLHFATTSCQQVTKLMLQPNFNTRIHGCMGDHTLLASPLQNISYSVFLGPIFVSGQMMSRSVTLHTRHEFFRGLFWMQGLPLKSFRDRRFQYTNLNMKDVLSIFKINIDDILCYRFPSMNELAFDPGNDLQMLNASLSDDAKDMYLMKCRNKTFEMYENTWLLVFNKHTPHSALQVTSLTGFFDIANGESAVSQFLE